MVKSIGIDSAATNLSWSSVSKSAGLKSSITIFLHTFTQSRKSDMLLDQSVKSSEGSFAFRPRSQKSRFWTYCIRPLAFPAKLCTSSAVKLVRWLPDWLLETIGFRCETLRQFCMKLLRPVIAWLTTYDHWLLLRNFSPVSGVKFYGEYLTYYIRPLAFAAKLYTSSGVKLFRWLSYATAGWQSSFAHWLGLNISSYF